MTGINNKGFTLLEVVVSIGIFSMVVILAVGALSRSSFQQRIQIGEQAVQEDLRIALEVFSREARLAYGNTFFSDDVSGDPYIILANQYNYCVMYRLDKDEEVLYRNQGEKAPGTDCAGVSFDPANDQPLTNAGVTHVTDMDFRVRPAAWVGVPGTRKDLTSQGYITLVLSAESPRGTGRPFRVQTTIASHQVNRNAANSNP